MMISSPSCTSSCETHAKINARYLHTILAYSGHSTDLSLATRARLAHLSGLGPVLLIARLIVVWRPSHGAIAALPNSIRLHIYRLDLDEGAALGVKVSVCACRRETKHDVDEREGAIHAIEDSKLEASIQMFVQKLPKIGQV